MIEVATIHQRASSTNPRSVDLSGAQLTVTSAAILSDVFTIEWGLRKVIFRECDLDEHVGVVLFNVEFKFNLFDHIDAEAYVTCTSDTRDPIVSVSRVQSTAQGTSVQTDRGIYGKGP